MAVKLSSACCLCTRTFLWLLRYTQFDFNLQDLVVTKYNMAADIVNAVLKEILTKCQSTPYHTVGEICDFGDKLMFERISKVRSGYLSVFCYIGRFSMFSFF